MGWYPVAPLELPLSKRSDSYDTCEYDGDRACAVEAFLDVLGGRWKGMILFHLAAGTKRFGELRRALPNVTQRVLTAQLRELERDGVVARHVYAEVPSRVEYSLAPIGRELEPVLRLMSDWGDAYMKLRPDLLHAESERAKRVAP